MVTEREGQKPVDPRALMTADEVRAALARILADCVKRKAG